MRVENSTNYDTRVLRSLVIAVYNSLKAEVGHPLRGWNNLIIDVHYGRRKVSGQGVIGLRVPKVDPTRAVLKQLAGGGAQEQASVRRLAYYVWWYLMHEYRLGDRIPKNVGMETFAWAEERFGEVVPLLPPKVKAKTTREQLQQKRLKRVLELKKQWLRKQKLAETKLKKLDQRQKYYERALRTESPTS
jgi:hypothetical protein